MTPPASTTIVITVRSDREYLVLHTTDGPVSIRLKNMNKTRSQAVIKAPKAVGIRRVALEDSDAK